MAEHQLLNLNYITRGSASLLNIERLQRGVAIQLIDGVCGARNPAKSFYCGWVHRDPQGAEAEKHCVDMAAKAILQRQMGGNNSAVNQRKE